MRRVLKYLIPILAAVVVMAAAGAVAWLAGTTDGARRLMAAASRSSGLDISAKSVEGKLAGTLILKNLSIRWPQGSVKVEQVKLSAYPQSMLAGKLHLQTATLKNVSIEDNEPDKPPVLQWPKVSGWMSRFDCSVDRLDIENITYHRPGKKPLKLSKMTASLDWNGAYLSVYKINIVSDDVFVSGDIRAGFSRPLLDINIVFVPSQSILDMASFRLQGKFRPAKYPEQIAGNLQLSGSRKKQDIKPLWELSLDAAMTDQGFPLRKIRLTQSEENGVVQASGMLTFKGTKPFLSLKAEAKDVAWTSGFNIPARLSGSLSLEGTANEYGGNFSLANSGKSWQKILLAGDFSGNDEAVKISIGKGGVLNGSLTGHLDIDWREGAVLNVDLYGRNLNPAIIGKDWSGQINFDLKGRMQSAGGDKPSGELSVLLRQSRLHGQSLTGNLHATFSGDDVDIQHLALRGKGFQILAAGAVKNNLSFAARISDLSGLLPGTSGFLSAKGRLRHLEKKVSGDIMIHAQKLSAYDLTVASADIKASLDDRDKAPLSIQATAQKLGYKNFHADQFVLQARGTTKSHSATAMLRAGSNEVHLALTGSYASNEWRGTISRLEGTDKMGAWRLVQPTAMVISSSGLSLDSIVITGGNSETVKASFRLAQKPLSGFILLDWSGVNLQRISAWLDQNSITGFTQGYLHLNFLPQKRITLAGKASLQGAFNIQGKSVGIRQGLLNVDANEKGTHADLSLSLTGGGTLKGTFSSAAPEDLSFPDEGRFNLQLQDFDPAFLSPILPKPVRIEGKIAGEAEGRLLPGNRITMTGRVSASESKVHMLGQKSDISIDLREASLTWVWRDDALSGSVLMKLSEYGKLDGRFRLPVAARLPATFDEKGMVQASLSGVVREKGALTALFPGLIQESRGRLDLDLNLAGAWKEPHLTGNARLSKAGGYLPTAGITIRDAGITARFFDDTIFIDSMDAFSGPGQIKGSGVIRMKGGEITGFEGRLDGDRFQTIYFPELQVLSSPKLTFSGTPEKITVAGEILLPDVSIIRMQSASSVAASPDVVRVGKTKPAPRKLPFDLDARVKILLGDSVVFKTGSIDAQLAGNVDLHIQDIDRISGRGEIRSVKGRFQTYGVNLDIVRGRLTFTGGPVNQPGLDILALKTIGEVKAGVTVTGKLPSPLIKLYSEPVMQDMDILAYIVLGHPLGSNTEQANLLAMAAGALLSSKQAEGLQSQIKNRLGLSSFDISTGVVEKTNRMGYKPVKVASAGTTTASTESVGETMVVIGRYLTPKLYVSYGRSLFTGSNLFSLRYNLSKSWQVESQTGTASGVDIYYKLEFN